MTTSQETSTLTSFSLVLALFLIPSSTVLAEQSSAERDSMKAWISVESRLFESDNLDLTLDQAFDVKGHVDWKVGINEWQLRLAVLGQAAAIDTKRNFIFPEQVYLGYRKGLVQIRAGFHKFTWSDMETFHPADILNVRNFDTRIENPEKIGEPAVHLRLGSDSITVDLVYLPMNLVPWGPSKHSRMNLLPPGFVPTEILWVTRDRALSSDSFRHQWAARLGKSLGGARVDFHIVQHQDMTQPTFMFDPLTSDLLAVLHPVTQIGGTYTQKVGGLTVRFEAARRIFSGGFMSPLYGPVAQVDHDLAALGFEFKKQILGRSESTFYLEGQGLFSVTEDQRAGLSLFQRDAMVGYRHEFNDSVQRKLFVSFIFDIERENEYLWSLTYSQNIWKRLRLEFGWRLVDAPQEESFPVGLEVLNNSDHLQLSLKKPF